MGLLRLSGGGLEVPPFIILTTKFFQLSTAEILPDIHRQTRQLAHMSPDIQKKIQNEIRNKIESAEISPKQKEILTRAIDEVPGWDGPLSVRSSAVDEDGTTDSFAGQLNSYLYCYGIEQVLNRIRQCQASAWSDRALAYRRARGIPLDNIEVAVIIQKMIPGVASGVTFTLNPLTCRMDEVLINAVPGLGEGLVSGGQEADRFVISRGPGLDIMEESISHKTHQSVPDRESGNGTVTVEIADELRDRPSLNRQQVRDVARACLEAEKCMGAGPQDVEWTQDEDGEIHILQSRPITTIQQLRPSRSEYETIWDNSNIVESYSGVTTPLTFSFASNAYHRVYVQFCQILRVPAQVIEKNDFYLRNMIGLLQGRVYYNLKNWYRLISLMPGYSYNRRFMEQMMGVRRPGDYNPADESSPGFFQRFFVHLPRLAVSGASLLWSFLTIHGRSRKFQRIIHREFNKFRDFDFEGTDSHRLLEIYNHLESSVLGNWKAPIINDFMAMISMGLLGMLIERWELDPDNEGLKNRLLSGQGNIESTRPVKALQDMAQFIANHREIADQFNRAFPDELARIYCGPRLPPGENRLLQEMIREYLHCYQYRSIGELKLEVPSLREEPAFIFSILKNYLKSPPPARGKDEPDNCQARRDARGRLGWRMIMGFIPARWAFDLILSFAKKAVSFREYQRFARTNMFGLMRRLFLGLGKNLYQLGAINSVQDVFYLEMNELFSYIVGTWTGPSLKSTIALRKKEFEQYQDMKEPPDRLVTYGPVYCNQLESLPGENPADTLIPGVFTGTGCSPGKVRGTVKLITSPDDNLELGGEILVAPRTDPGWIPLYPSASGLLVERGSILSHSAIVAREMELPAIVGLSGITGFLKTGDLVEMDGGTGTVRIINPSPEE